MSRRHEKITMSPRDSLAWIECTGKPYQIMARTGLKATEIAGVPVSGALQYVMTPRLPRSFARRPLRCRNLFPALGLEASWPCLPWGKLDDGRDDKNLQIKEWGY